MLTQNLSQAARRVIDQEVRRGDVLANRFRFGLATLLTVVAVTAAGGNPTYLAINLTISLVYLGVVALQAVQLRRSESAFVTYTVLAVEFALMLAGPIAYTILESGGELAFLVKNPFLLLILLPLLLSGIQFRRRVTTVAGVVSIGLLAGILVYAIGFSDLNLTTEATLHLGIYVSPQLLVPPVLVIFVSVAAVLRFSNVRLRAMVGRIGTLEAERTSLSRYFSPAVVEEITRNPDVVTSGARQPVTILFCDIRDFTSTAESLSPERLAELLSSFREVMTATIFEHHGTVDKFIGDSIMATFGTPRPSQDADGDARNGVFCARHMLTVLAGFNDRFGLRGKQAWRVGIALHSGPVFAGTIGESASLEYTVIGNTVNIASRMEGLCRELEAQILVSQQVIQALGSGEPAQRLAPVSVRGRSEPLQLYKLA